MWIYAPCIFMRWWFFRTLGLPTSSGSTTLSQFTDVFWTSSSPMIGSCSGTLTQLILDRSEFTRAVPDWLISGDFILSCLWYCRSFGSCTWWWFWGCFSSCRGSGSCKCSVARAVFVWISIRLSEGCLITVRIESVLCLSEEFVSVLLRLLFWLLLTWSLQGIAGIWILKSSHGSYTGLKLFTTMLLIEFETLFISIWLVTLEPRNKEIGINGPLPQPCGLFTVSHRLLSVC